MCRLIAGCDEARAQPVANLRYQLAHGFVQFDELALCDHGVTAQSASLLGRNRERLAQVLVDAFDDAGHLRNHPVLGRLGFALGEQPVLAHVRLGRPELAVHLAHKILQASSRSLRRRFDGPDEAA